jgi:GDPmannose 4,6-dehydratase
MNLLDTNYLEFILCLIRPDRIIHLASISNTEECEQYPIRTIDTNGRLVANMCDIIFRNKLPCKLFNASSSELYKGHLEYVITDDDESLLPTTTYAIAKTLGHTFVNKYRQTYNMPFSNGIIFMTESKRRSDNFLLKKVALHARYFKETRTPICLGNLDSWRNINHAEDVATAIRTILDQKNGATYVICSSNFHKVQDLVVDIYKCFDIFLEPVDNCLVDKTTGMIVAHIGSSLRSQITKINGNPKKLTDLGWSPKYTTQAILDELCETS